MGEDRGVERNRRRVPLTSERVDENEGCCTGLEQCIQSGDRHLRWVQKQGVKKRFAIREKSITDNTTWKRNVREARTAVKGLI